jgi:membrane-bound metal-dependent hydrolase YbcI (DUF457 family)
MIFPLLNIPILIVSSVIVDIEPLLMNLQHGFFHSYLGATVAGLLIAAVAMPFKKNIEWVSTNLISLPQKVSSRSIIFTSLFGVWLHVFLDSFLYPEMKPFLPFDGNPFLNLIPTLTVYEIAFYAFIPALVIYVLRVYLTTRRGRTNQEKPA